MLWSFAGPKNSHRLILLASVTSQLHFIFQTTFSEVHSYEISHIAMSNNSTNIPVPHNRREEEDQIRQAMAASLGIPVESVSAPVHVGSPPLSPATHTRRSKLPFSKMSRAHGEFC